MADWRRWLKNGGPSTWRSATAYWLVVVALLLWLFRDATAAMVFKWWQHDSHAHAFFIAPIALWLAYQRRQLLSGLPIIPSAWGLAATLVAGMVWMFGWLADAAIIQEAGVVLAIQASFVAVFGLAWARALAFPLFYLLLAVPFGDELVPALQQFTAAFVVKAVELAGIPVYWDGIFISIPRGNFEVAETCSGVRFLTASFTLGLFYANYAFHSWRRRAAVIALSILIPVVANGFRAFGIVMIAHLSNMKYAVGADHIIFGWIFFSVVMVLLILVGRTFADGHMDVAPKPLAKEQTSRPAGIVAAAGLGAALAVSIWPGYATYLSGTLQPRSLAAIEFPLPAEWRLARAANFPWQPEFLHADAEKFGSFLTDGGQFDVYLAYYAHQRPGAELIQYGNSVAGQAPWGVSKASTKTIEVGGTSYSFVDSRVVAGVNARTVWHWYWVDGYVTNNRYIAKVLLALSKLHNGGDGSAVLVLAVDDRHSAGEPAVLLARAVGEIGDIEAFVAGAVGLRNEGSE